MADRELKWTILGDSKSLEKSFDNVGAGAKEMAADLDKAAEDAKLFGKAMDRATDAADSSESKFMGTADILDGLGSAFGLPLENMTGLSRAFGDLSGGFATLGPSIKGLGGSLGSLASGPMGLIVAGVAAAAAGLVLLWQNSETFRDIVTGAFEAVSKVVGPVVEVIGGAIGWLGDKLGFGGDKAKEDVENKWIAAAELMQAAYQEAFSDMGSAMDSMVGPFERFNHGQTLTLEEANKNLENNLSEYNKWIEDIEVIYERFGSATARYVLAQGPEFHGVADQLANSTEMMGSHFQWMVEDMEVATTTAQTLARELSGLTFIESAGKLANVVPRMLGPKRHSGGIVPGPMGREMSIVAQGGERVIPLGQSGGGGTQVVQVVIDKQIVGEVVLDQLLKEQRRSGNLGFEAA